VRTVLLLVMALSMLGAAALAEIRSQAPAPTASVATGQSAARPAAPDPVQQADMEFAKAVAERNFGRFKDLIAEDATFFGGAGRIRKGRETVSQGWQYLFDPAAKTSVTWGPIQSEVSGTLGYTIGRAEWVEVDAQGKRNISHSHYVTIWRRHPDGKWRAVVDIGAPEVSKER
jgi:ketosteroid isomerase-like protein